MQRWSHYVHIVLLKKRFEPLRICPWEALKESFESAWVHASQQHARLWADVLEGMHHIFWDKDERPGGGAGDAAVAELEVKLPAQDVEELIFRAVDVQGRSTPQHARVPPHPKRAARLLMCGEDLGGVRFTPERPREAGSLVGEHDKPLFLMCHNR